MTTNPGGRCVLAGEELDAVYQQLRFIEDAARGDCVRGYILDSTKRIKTILARANDATQAERNNHHAAAD